MTKPIETVEDYLESVRETDRKVGAIIAGKLRELAAEVERLKSQLPKNDLDNLRLEDE